MYLLDTHVVSELRKVQSGKADPAVAAWAGGVAMSDLFISAITLEELGIGVLLAERREPPQGHRCAPGWSARSSRPLPDAYSRSTRPRPDTVPGFRCPTRARSGMPLSRRPGCNTGSRSSPAMSAISRALGLAC